jgi:pyridoxal phosphate enzyme (YggS family)
VQVLAQRAAQMNEFFQRRLTHGDGTANPKLRWHMIGHLQRNKSRVAAAMFDVVHSIDSATLAQALDRHRPDGMERLRVLVEVELTGIAGRTGAHPDDLPAVFDALRDCVRLSPVGLMTIAPPHAPEAARACFARLRALREWLGDAHGIALRELSMGMSEDFEIAVSEGATLLRLGRVLFGDRPPVGPAHDAAILSPT